MTTAYLITNPPVRSQFRAVRRESVTGAIVVHTAESMLDAVGPDTGAENVARFIRGRSDAGSYHDIVDSDSIVHVVPYASEAFGARTGNAWALHLSFACRAADWPTMDADRRAAMIANGAQAAARMARWCRDVHGRPVPATIIDDVHYRIGAPGFISHAAVDPGRRTDPGRGFPWTAFLDAFRREMETPTMPENPYAAEVNEALQLLTDHAGYTGEPDGWFGPMALEALHRLKNTRLSLAEAYHVLQSDHADLAARHRAALHDLNDRNGKLATLNDRNGKLATQVASLTDDRDAARADLDAMRRQPAGETLDALRPLIEQAAALLEGRP